MPIPYSDFEIEIGSGNGRTYPVAVLRSPAGETKAKLSWPFSQLQLENKLLTLQNALLRSGGPKRRALTPVEKAVQDFGAELFGTLFAGEVGTLYYESRQLVAQAGRGLRIKLRIEDPHLATLPWEYLYDPRSDEYLSRSSFSPLVRYLPLTHPVAPLKVKPPLRILAMTASPQGMPALDAQVERQRMQRGLADLINQGVVELEWLEGETWQELRRKMRNQTWHIFHFVGHGGFDEVRKEGMVVFSDRRGQPRSVAASQLAQLLRDHHSLRLAVFNSCEGARADRHDIFSSTATSLVRAGIPAVLAMQYEITDAAAMQFAESLYETLAEGAAIDTAVVEARIAISMEVTNSLEWGTPVLFMRSPDGVIFELASASAPQPDPAQPAMQPRQTIPAQVRQPDPEPLKPKFPVDFDWVPIPAGEFIMGSTDERGLYIYKDEKPQHNVYLPAFQIARVPVTNTQFRTFVEASGYRTTAEKKKYAYASVDGNWRDVEGADWAHPNGPGSHVRDKADHPVVSVSWYDAQAFCKWAGVLLPSEAQWEKAARGTDGWLWPWGNDKPTGDHCNFAGTVGDTTPVGRYVRGASPYGVMDMSGNVLEWTSSIWKSYPYDADDGREDQSGSSIRVLRGGSFLYFSDIVRCASRSGFNPYRRYGLFGFRVLAPGS